MDHFDSNLDIPQQERRPPIYNAEDYVLGLKKFCKLTGLQLYLDQKTPVLEEDPVLINNRKNKHHGHGGNGNNPSLGNSGSGSLGPAEMGLKQFSTITDLLVKLKDDLTLSFPSFIREFIGEPNDGVTHLLDALKAIQLAQTNITGSLNQLGSRANHVMFKKALNDEFEVLLCLKLCSKFEDGALKLVDHHSGLFTVAVCVMSNYSKSRVLSLQLLTRLCDMSQGHKQVSDAISMLRLRFGEPVRLKFLVGMLNSYNSSAFHISCLRFLNRFVETAKDTREKILIQTELEEAGFDLLPLKKMLLQGSMDSQSRNELLQEELDRWLKNYIDVNALVKKLLDAERANRKLREELSNLKDKFKTSEEERRRNTGIIERLRYELNSSCTDCNTTQEEIEEVVDRNLELAQVETEECSLVTVLASDGYTCITSPVMSARSIPIHENSETEQEKEVVTQTSRQIIRCSGTDSGLSSEEGSSDGAVRNHLSSSSSSGSNDEMKNVVIEDCNSSDKSSYSEKQEKESAKETEADRLQDLPDDEIDMVYAERNVLHEEATTVEAETITVDRFRQRFCNTTEKGQQKFSENTNNITISSNTNLNTNSDQNQQNQQQPKYKAPPPPPRQRRTSSSSTIIKSSTELLTQEDHETFLVERSRRPRSVVPAMDHNEQQQHIVQHSSGPPSDVVIVPRRGPRPPSRKRPKSTPIINISHMMAEKKREMIFLPDLSDGETSDNMANVEEDEDDDEVVLNSNPGFNSNTLETMSARSFGFIKPSQKFRDNDMANRIRRHQSFFNADTSSITGGNHHGGGGRGTRSNKPRPLAMIRRAESFHHSRSLGDFDHLTRDESPDPRGSPMSHGGGIRDSRSLHNPDLDHRSMMNANGDNNHNHPNKNRLHKSKSMEFLKAKLLSRKSSTKLSAAPPHTPQHNHGPLDPRLFPTIQQQQQENNNSNHHGKNPNKNPVLQRSKTQYDWRQDTPFWNKPRSLKPQVPANKPKLSREEPWTHLHATAGAGPSSLWPGGQHGYPGLFLGRKAGVPGGGNFYPSFNVANPKNPGNVSRNVLLPGPVTPRPGPPQFVGPHYPQVAFAAAAAAAAAQAAAQVASSAAAQVNKQRPTPVLSESLKDRLEITELSDSEDTPSIPVPDYQQQQQQQHGGGGGRRTPSESSGGGRRSSSACSSHHGKILDMPSGLY